MTVEIIFFSIGLLLIFSEIIFRWWLKRDSGLIPESYENMVLVFFILGSIGLWLILFPAGIIAFKSWNFSPRWFILIGVITGITSALKNFIFWALSDDRYAKKPALGEPIGGMGLGCFGLMILPSLGLITGLLINFLLK